MASRLVALFAIVTLVGCGGIRQSSLLPLASNANVPQSGIVPSYVGPSTKGMTVDIAGPTTFEKTVSLTLTVKGCKSKLMTLGCTLKIALKTCPGKKACYHATVRTYDAYSHGRIPGGAKLLSEDESFAFAIRNGASVVPLVLYGVPKSIAFLPSTGSSLSGTQTTGFIEPKCAAAPQTVEILAKDADDNFITGAGVPAITLVSDDPSQLAVSRGAGRFVLLPPVLPAYPHGGHTVHLTAKATAPKNAGHASASSVVDVSYSKSICGTITEFTVPSGASKGPYGITSGPDGALWFTEKLASRIGRMTTDGAYTEYGSAIAAGARPWHITTGPDRNLWFTECVAAKVGKITTNGALTEYQTLSAGSDPGPITAGPDGRLWFTESGANVVGASTTGGVMSEYPVLSSSAGLEGIVTGPDGDLYFTEGSVDKIGRMGTAGGATEIGIPIASSEPIGIVAGSDGQLWFTEAHANRIGRLNPKLPAIDSTFALPELSSVPEFATLGADGSVWFVEINGNRIAQISVAGTITEYAVPTGAAHPSDLAVGSDGSIWFTEYTGGKIGRIR